MGDQGATWDDIIAETEKDRFVGREHELARFSQEIGKAKPSTLIFYISGQGGVGKTKLLEQFQKVALEQQFLVADSDEQQKDIPTILGHFAAQLEQAEQNMEPFSKRYAHYRQLRQEIESDVDAPQGLAGALARTSVNLVWGLLDEIPVAQRVTRLAPDAMREGSANQAGEWADYLSRKLESRDDISLMRDPVADLSPLFFQAINRLASKHKLLLCFDTYEYTRGYLDGWLVHLRDYRPSPNIRLAIAGQDFPGPVWDDLKSVTAHITLEGFTPSEAEAFLDLRGIDDPQRRQEILGFSDRLPVLMDWLAVPAGDRTDRQAPVTDIVERFLRWERDPNLRQTMLYLAVPYTFNQDLVALLIGKEDPAEAKTEFNWLCGLPSTKPRENGWQYHEVVRQRLLHYLRQKSPRMYADLHNHLAGYYQMQREGLDLTPEKQWVNRRWQAYTVEHLYHHLVAAPDSRWVDVLDLFTLALRHQRLLARAMIERLNRPACCDELSIEQQQTVVLFLGQLDAIQAGELPDGAAMFSRLCQEPDLSTISRAIALTYRGETNRQMGNCEAALADFDRAIELDEKSAWSIAHRGKTYRQMGDYEAALADFDRAIELDEKSAWAIAHRGETYQQMGKYEAALADFDRAIALDEKSAWAIAHRGETYQLMGKYEAALADFSRAIALDEKSAWAIASRGKTYRLMGKYEAALADFGRAIALDEKSAWAIASRGKTYRLMGKYEAALADFGRAIRLAALADFGRAIELDENSAWAIAHRGETYRLMGKYEAALADFDWAIELDEKSAWAIAHRGEAYRLMGNYEAALADFDRAIELDEGYVWAMVHRGKTYRLLDDHNAALADFDRAIELDEESAWAIALQDESYWQMGSYKAVDDFDGAFELDEEYAWAIAHRGETSRQWGDYEAALADFDRAIELGERSAWVVAGRGEIYRLMGNYKAALDDFDWAIALGEESAWVVASRGETYRQLDDYEAALADFDRAIALGEESAWVVASRGETYRQLDNYDAALADFDRAIELDKRYAWAIAHRGETYRQMENYKAALADFDRAIEMDEKSAWAVAHRGETYRLMGNYDAALADYDRAIEMDEKSAWAVAHRGETYRLRGDYEAALADFGQAIRLEELADFGRAIEMDEKPAWAIARRGETYRLMGDYEEALDDFDRAIALDEGYAWAIAHRGQTYRQLGRYEAALADFDRAIALDEESDWYYYGRSLARLAQAQTETAKSDFKQAITLAAQAYQTNPKDWQNVFSLALYQLIAGQTAEAKRLYREGTEAPVYIIREALHALEDLLTVLPANEQAIAMCHYLLSRLEQRW
jgi:tetratricopeptide (TPR) repeat protein